MKLELLQFSNTNHIILPGLLYNPDKGSDKILIALHGNGSSAGFYSVELQNTFGKFLTDNGISYFTFTNTGGHLIQKFDKVVGEKTDRVVAGCAYELIKDCISDIDGVIKYLKSRGYRHLYLIGGSTGANKICVYNFYKEKYYIEKYILQSGGDDAGYYYSQVGEKLFKKVLLACKDKIEEGGGRDLVPLKFGVGYLSYQSLYDQINPDGDYNIFPFYWQLNGVKVMQKDPWREIKKITKPTLIIYGDRDEYCYGKVEECLKLIKDVVYGSGNFSFEKIAGADHAFFGKRSELVQKVVEFLKKP